MTAPVAPPTGAATQAVNVTKVYGQGNTQVRALDGVSADFARGQFHAIIGSVTGRLITSTQQITRSAPSLDVNWPPLT